MARSCGQIIALTSGEIVISKNLTIDGSALALQVTISGNNASRVFNITTAGNTVTLNNLTIVNSTNGVYISTGSTLTVSACNFNNNTLAAPWRTTAR